eukprot:3523826-Prymnesium_polylepis.2
MSRAWYVARSVWQAAAILWPCTSGPSPVASGPAASRVHVRAHGATSPRVRLRTARAVRLQPL